MRNLGPPPPLGNFDGLQASKFGTGIHMRLGLGPPAASVGQRDHRLDQRPFLGSLDVAFLLKSDVTGVINKLTA